MRNRRMPNGTYGGVGGKGAKENLSLPDLPDWSKLHTFLIVFCETQCFYNGGWATGPSEPFGRELKVADGMELVPLEP